MRPAIQDRRNVDESNEIGVTMEWKRPRGILARFYDADHEGMGGRGRQEEDPQEVQGCIHIEGRVLETRHRSQRNLSNFFSLFLSSGRLYVTTADDVGTTRVCDVTRSTVLAGYTPFLSFPPRFFVPCVSADDTFHEQLSLASVISLTRPGRTARIRNGGIMAACDGGTSEIFKQLGRNFGICEDVLVA